jgi:hypothetical protein
MDLLRETATATTAANGEAEAVIGPVPPWQRWSIDRVAVSATAGDPEARLFRDRPSPGNLLGGTHTGRLDTYESSGGPIVLEAGQSLAVVWSKGTPGSSCTATAMGHGIQ